MLIIVSRFMVNVVSDWLLIDTLNVVGKTHNLMVFLYKIKRSIMKREQIFTR